MKALEVLVGDPVRVSANDVEIVRDGGVIGAAREGSVAGLDRRGGMTVEDRSDEAGDQVAQPFQTIGRNATTRHVASIVESAGRVNAEAKPRDDSADRRARPLIQIGASVSVTVGTGPELLRP